MGDRHRHGTGPGARGLHPPPRAGHPASGEAGRWHLAVALGLIASFMTAEVVAALLAHSLALLADAGHMLTDAGALAGALWAIRLAARPASARWSYGLKRAEILSGAVNGITLVGVAAVILVEAVHRLLHPIAVTGPTVLAVAVAGLAVNGIAAWVLSRANRSSLNIEGAFRHMLTDAAGFAATAAAALIIITTGFARADPVASLLVVALMGGAAWGLLKASGRVLLEGTPEGVDLGAVRAHLLAASEHVLAVHDLHAWAVTASLPAVSAHVVVDDSCFCDGHAPRILDALQAALAGQFDVEHSTLQLELPGHTTHEPGSHR